MTAENILPRQRTTGRRAPMCTDRQPVQGEAYVYSKDGNGLIGVTENRPCYRYFEYLVIDELKGLTSSITLCYKN